MRTFGRLLAAAGLALGVSLAAPVVAPTVPFLGAVPAHADACTGTDGVTVVVDFNGLGGGVSQACVAGSGGSARGLFQRAGVRMQDVTGEQGFVCRVQNKPGPEACSRVSNGAYWSLWWSDGNGRWTYSQEGVDLLSVGSGGFVAWSWTKQAPSASASRPEPQAPPSTGGANGGGTGGGTTGGGSGGAGSPGDGPSSSAPSDAPEADPSASEDASEDPTADGGDSTGGQAGKKDRAGKGAKGTAAKGKDRAGARKDRRDRDGAREGGGESVDSPLTDENGDTEQVSSASEEDPAGLPVWVPIAVLVVLAAGGVGAVVWRRRTGGHA
ncbi:hypothetical protein [Nocardioides sp. CFH 31398]|uniref:hypothetical protein n=1 Tax=Nocardioides sp. CFH 31398 TaxID=2919579 RepID=UPI001F06EEEB|nr:hypothetical protein [Nocardioides sp. CFH 31398]MCH1867294.1 hypothetical protein [Nocardioides sp. CFH 31398]